MAQTLDIDARGRLTLPDEIRQAAHIEAPGRIAVRVRPDGLLLCSRSTDLPDEIAESASLKGPVDTGETLAEETEAEHGDDAPLGSRAPGSPPRTVLEALEDDMAWVRQNLDRLIEEYGHVYVAVRDGRVLGKDHDRASLVMRLFHENPRQGCLVVSLDDPRARGEEEEPDYVPGAIDEDDMV